MKKVTIILTGVILMSIASLSVNAQSQTATKTQNASATIVTPIAIASDVDMKFGLLSPTATAGTVLLTPEATTSRTATGVTLLGTLPVTSAKYTITGEENAVYSIVIPGDGVVKISNGTPANDMYVNSFTRSSGYVANGNVMATGDNVMYVGATLNVGAGQAPGKYTGTYDVTVTYE